MDKILIPEYDDQKEATKEYIKRSTKATGNKEVRKYLKNYIMQNDCKEETENFIRMYLENIALLNKTKLVSDGSYRSCVILVRPDTLYVTHDGGLHKKTKNFDYTLNETLQYFLNNAEKIFLNVTDITLKEDMNKHAKFMRYSEY